MPSRILGAFVLVAGALNFIKPRPYEAIMPEALPAHRELVYLSGVAEMAGGAGVLSRRTSRAAGWWLIATMLAVFPANINMAVEAERFERIPEPLLWARLPLQAGLVSSVLRRGGRPPPGARP